MTIQPLLHNEKKANKRPIRTEVNKWNTLFLFAGEKRYGKRRLFYLRIINGQHFFF